MTPFKLVRWVLTVAFVLVSYQVLVEHGLIAALIVMLPIALLWFAPQLFGATAAPVTPKHRADFEPDIGHDNIALDTGRDILWIRDPVRGERYLTRGEILSARTEHDWNNGTFRQRIELHISDVQSPNWQVLFQRHSDSWVKTSKRNGAERDEWFARVKAWSGLATIR